MQALRRRWGYTIFEEIAFSWNWRPPLRILHSSSSTKGAWGRTRNTIYDLMRLHSSHRSANHHKVVERERGTSLLSTCGSVGGCVSYECPDRAGMGVSELLKFASSLWWARNEEVSRAQVNEWDKVKIIPLICQFSLISISSFSLIFPRPAFFRALSNKRAMAL